MNHFVRRTARDRTGEFTRAELLRWQALLDCEDTQIASTFRLLKQNKGRWVTLPAIGRRAKSRCVSQLVQRLRKSGCVIENRMEAQREPGRRGMAEVHSWYRLLKEPKDLAREL